MGSCLLPIQFLSHLHKFYFRGRKEVARKAAENGAARVRWGRRVAPSLIKRHPQAVRTSIANPRPVTSFLIDLEVKGTATGWIMRGLAQLMSKNRLRPP